VSGGIKRIGNCLSKDGCRFLVFAIWQAGGGLGTDARFFVGDKAFVFNIFGGTGMSWIVVVIFINNGMDHYSLLVDCEGGIGRHCYPTFSLEGQRLASNEDDICAFVATISDNLPCCSCPPM